MISNIPTLIMQPILKAPMLEEVIQEHTVSSLFGRLNYDLMDRYMLNCNCKKRRLITVR